MNPANGVSNGGKPSKKNGSSSRFLIEVAAKHGQPDAPSAALFHQLALIGVAGAREIRISSLYEITGSLTRGQAQQVSRELLTDPITQESRMDRSASSQAFLLGPHWRIEVWLKPSVTDPAGQSVAKAVVDMGLPRPDAVRTGTAYRVLGKLSRVQAEKIAHQLLANPVIHRTSVEPQ